MGGNIVDVPNTASKRRRRSSHVRFKEEEEIINPGTDGLYDVATLKSICLHIPSYGLWWHYVFDFRLSVHAYIL